MGDILRLIEARRYTCTTPTAEGTCGYRWMLDVPAAGRRTYQIACPRCGHSFEVTVTTPRRRTPKRTPKPEPAPAPICSHPGNGFWDQRDQHRCSACGEQTRGHTLTTRRVPCVRQ